jgi:hypothetical protein
VIQITHCSLLRRSTNPTASEEYKNSLEMAEELPVNVQYGGGDPNRSKGGQKFEPVGMTKETRDGHVPAWPSLALTLF